MRPAEPVVPVSIHSVVVVVAIVEVSVVRAPDCTTHAPTKSWHALFSVVVLIMADGAETPHYQPAAVAPLIIADRCVNTKALDFEMATGVRSFLLLLRVRKLLEIWHIHQC